MTVAGGDAPGKELRRTLEEERGDDPPVPFSFLSGAIDRPQIACHLVHTTERVHALVREHIGDSPLFNGQISGIGPRYCPSLEDKVMRFPHRERHQIFLEPEGIEANEIYVNGYSMCLPEEVQARIVHALPGLEGAEIIRPGYGFTIGRCRSTLSCIVYRRHC